MAAKKCKFDGAALEGHDAEEWNQMVVDSLRYLCQEDPEKLMECVTDGSLDDAKILKMIAEDGPFGCSVSKEGATMDEIVISLVRHHSQAFKKDARCWRHKSTARRTRRLAHLSLQALLDLGNIQIEAKKDTNLHQVEVTEVDSARNLQTITPRITPSSLSLAGLGAPGGQAVVELTRKVPHMECRHEDGYGSDGKEDVLAWPCPCETCRLKYSNLTVQSTDLSQSVNKMETQADCVCHQQLCPSRTSSYNILNSRQTWERYTGDGGWMVMPGLRMALSNPEMTQHETDCDPSECSGYMRMDRDSNVNVLGQLIHSDHDNMYIDDDSRSALKK